MDEESSSKAKEKKKEKREKSKLTKEVEIVHEKRKLLFLGSRQSDPGGLSRTEESTQRQSNISVDMARQTGLLTKPWRKLEKTAWTPEVTLIVMRLDTGVLNFLYNFCRPMRS